MVNKFVNKTKFRLCFIGIPTFKLLSKHSPENDPRIDIPVIEVTFPNGKSDRLILYYYDAIPNSTNSDPLRSCTYLGNLENEKDASIAVTGCPDAVRNPDKKMLITLFSSQSPGQSSFVINLNHDEKRMIQKYLIVEKRLKFGLTN